MNAPTIKTVLSCAVAVFVGVAVLTSAALSVTHLKRGEPAPVIHLSSLDGVDVDTAQLRTRILVVIFGETYHEKTRAACIQLQTVLEEPRFEGQPISSILVTAQELKPQHVQAEGAVRWPSTILRDPKREAFGAYRVAVMPSVVVIGPDGRVVHSIAGLTPQFADVLTDSLLLATGRLSVQRFEESLNPSPTTAATDDLRAARAAQLARQLARRGLDEMASEKYREALQLDPKDVSAHLDLGLLLLKHRRLAEAETHFQQVLAVQPNSMQGCLGLAFVQTLRGGAELDPAERTVRDVLARNPTEARAHYLLGLINEQRGKPQDAAACFKKSAQLLLERTDEE